MPRLLLRPPGSFFIRAAIVALLLGATNTSRARVSTDSSYTKQQTYSAALRYLRVDKGFDIVERDADAAYLIFAYPEPGQNGKQAQGTIEVIEVKDHVKLVVQLPRMPEYHEQLICDGLLKKLKREYGEAPVQKPKKSTSKKGHGDKKHPPEKVAPAPAEDDATGN
jgi:hypothetical protein